MAAAHMTTAASSRGFLPPFEGLRPSTVKVSSVSFRTSGGLTFGSTRGLVVKAAATVAPKYTTLKPLGDRVLVKISAAEEKTSGGILLPSTAQSKPQGGEVVAVGEGRTVGQHKVDVSVKTGAQVIYSKYAGTEVEFNGSNHLLLKEDDIVGILETDDVKDLKPLNDRVLIKITEAEETTAGGLLLTQASKEKPSTGTVIAVGPGPLGEDGSRTELTVSAAQLPPSSQQSSFSFLHFLSSSLMKPVLLSTTSFSAAKRPASHQQNDQSAQSEPQKKLTRSAPKRGLGQMQPSVRCNVKHDD